jgi:hypothetical protein
MSEFSVLRSKISLLGRAEYRYDRLVCDFAEHYLALSEAGYQPLPELGIVQNWWHQLNSVIRPELLAAWRAMAKHYGFALGARVCCGDAELYVVRVSCYPLENTVRFLGFGIKKDGSAAQSSVSVAVKEDSVVALVGQQLSSEVLSPLYFESSSKVAAIRAFLDAL